MAFMVPTVDKPRDSSDKPNPTYTSQQRFSSNNSKLSGHNGFLLHDNDLISWGELSEKELPHSCTRIHRRDGAKEYGGVLRTES